MVQLSMKWYNLVIVVVEQVGSFTTTIEVKAIECVAYLLPLTVERMKSDPEERSCIVELRKRKVSIALLKAVGVRGGEPGEEG